MNVFWKLYCSMDENGRKELLKRQFARPLSGPVNYHKMKKPLAFDNKPTL